VEKREQAAASKITTSLRKETMLDASYSH